MTDAQLASRIYRILCDPEGAHTFADIVYVFKEEGSTQIERIMSEMEKVGVIEFKYPNWEPCLGVDGRIPGHADPLDALKSKAWDMLMKSIEPEDRAIMAAWSWLENQKKDLQE